MKTLALALVLSLPVPKFAPPVQPTPTPSQQPAKHKGGKWYFAATGHAGVGAGCREAGSD